MLARALTILRAIERTFIAVVMVAMSLLYFINVVVRYFSPTLATELAWIDEATLFGLAWLVFVGFGLALERRRHIAMTALLDNMREPTARIVQTAINLIGLVFCLIFTKIGFDLALFIYNSGQISPTLGTTMLWLYAPLPIGFALLALRYLLELVGYQNRFLLRDVIQDH
ncbi:MAG: TRAP transporter small permease [Pseudolabrys sp.]|nr:TRAP transporter small permease [Pseudolabrys sp.]MCW5684131.1 TRAP transporter small permease [Pseudolabrys sp.]